MASPIAISRIFQCLMGLILLLTIMGCDKDTNRQSAIIPEEETIATVNNKKISLALFHAQLYSFLNHYRNLVITDEKELVAVKEIVINQLIDEELIAQEAARKGIRVLEEEINAIVAESSTPYEGTIFKGNIKEGSLSETEWKNKLQQHLIQKKLVQTEVIDKIPITKREIQSYYQKHKTELVIPSAIKVRNITLSTEEEAKAIRSKLLQGKDFVTLVRKHSISPDRDVDGDLGYIKKGDLPVEMESAIFSKKYPKFKRRITDVIHSQDGFHVLRLEKYRRNQRLSLANAKSRIKHLLIEQKWDEYYNRWLNSLREKATISIDQAMLSREQGF